MPPTVLDASALLAYLHEEPGAEVVADAIANGTTISAVNLAEALSTIARSGLDPAQLADDFRRDGLLDGAIEVEPLTDVDAIEIGRLRPLTLDAGLSLGDRACLALARRLDATALTADRAWEHVAVDVELRQIR
ncbi:type II toxin-antitoxin system VapC family toxin [Conexibacter sp. JD483]|uniref:type II toxin-antitoxin system VapC family toxin n=1 Tax=unclassified Conexibacter TaxID=2627773 RepID=UPI0027247D5B|nr:MULTISPECIES: type II toxin-antitoxin system VapC family toxin [unclassified Conexibacter]MDO8185232.1 type II toxin-antitoxin system VapC family toxin [Conexibacter sp. CPCC 205706]MDO8198278.1 type II toxin-antitoxin system VapC family toxin [Conexibacter sp. CPCC 205762]MDR9367760.1 type II toxin-antitoxin system VapC family toxin [Conexibacter sp. JD483]